MAGSTDIMSSVVGMVLGYIENDLAQGKAEKSLEKYKNSFMAYDPMQLKLKDQLSLEKRMIQSGFSTDFKVARDIIGQAEAGGMSVASELARTNPALALMTMNQVSSQKDTSINKALGTIATQSMGYSSMISDLIDKIAQRKLNVDLLKASQTLATETALQESQHDYMTGVIGQLTGNMGGSGGGSNNTGLNISSMLNQGGSSGSGNTTEAFPVSDMLEYMSLNPVTR